MACAQLLGFMHQSAHAFHDERPAGHASSHADDAGHGSEVGAAAQASWLQELFAQHDDPTDCRLYDGMGHQVLGCGEPPVLPVLSPSTQQLRQLDADFVARWAALFDARGPPSSR